MYKWVELVDYTGGLKMQSVLVVGIFSIYG
jgi:hypothetical protein